MELLRKNQNPWIFWHQKIFGMFRNVFERQKKFIVKLVTSIPQTSK
jgi:hypothetical protein